jgi:hypothetical protein
MNICEIMQGVKSFRENQLNSDYSIRCEEISE